MRVTNVISTRYLKLHNLPDLKNAILSIFDICIKFSVGLNDFYSIKQKKHVLK